MGKRDLEFTTDFKTAYPIFAKTMFATDFGNPSNVLNTRAQLDTNLATFTTSEKSQFCNFFTAVSSSEYLSSFICHLDRQYLPDNTPPGRPFPKLDGDGLGNL